MLTYQNQNYKEKLIQIENDYKTYEKSYGTF